jgi:hypothetical protein
MFLLSCFIVSIVAIQGVSSLQCYGYLPGDNDTSILGIEDSTVLSGICIDPSCACISFMFQCSSDNTNALCSTQQQQNQAILWNYALVSNSTCEQFIESELGMNMTCCYTNLCNNQGLSANLTSVLDMTTISSQNSTSLLSFSIWIVLLALCFCV